MFKKEIELKLIFRIKVYMTEWNSDEITQDVWLF